MCVSAERQNVHERFHKRPRRNGVASSPIILTGVRRGSMDQLCSQVLSHAPFSRRPHPNLVLLAPGLWHSHFVHADVLRYAHHPHSAISAHDTQLATEHKAVPQVSTERVRRRAENAAPPNLIHESRYTFPRQPTPVTRLLSSRSGQQMTQVLTCFSNVGGPCWHADMLTQDC